MTSSIRRVSILVFQSAGANLFCFINFEHKVGDYGDREIGLVRIVAFSLLTRQLWRLLGWCSLRGSISSVEKWRREGPGINEISPSERRGPRTQIFGFSAFSVQIVGFAPSRFTILGL